MLRRSSRSRSKNPLYPMHIRLKTGVAGAALALFTLSAQAALNVLFLATQNDAAYQTYIEAQYPGAVWSHKVSGLVGDDLVGGDLDRVALFTGPLVAEGGETISVRSYMQRFDLVVVGVPTTSANFVDNRNGQDWAELNKPVLFHSAASSRSVGGRTGMFTGDGFITVGLGWPVDTRRDSSSALSNRLLAGSETATSFYLVPDTDTINGAQTFGTGEAITSVTDGISAFHRGLIFWTGGTLNGAGHTMFSHRAFLPLKGDINDLNEDGLKVLANVIDELLVPITTPIFPAPSGLIAAAGVGQVELTWNSVPTSISYNVKRSTVSGGPYTTIANVAGTTYTDTNVVIGTTYHYVVSGVGDVESPNSAQASATPVPTLQAATSILYIATSNSASYQSFATAGQFANNTWTFKAVGVGANQVGGDLDRVTDFTGTNGGTGISVRAYLERFDLIIVGVPTGSANFVDQANGADWAAITKPILFHSAFVARASGGRPGLFTGDNTLTFTHGNPLDSARVSNSALSDRLLAGVGNVANLYAAIQSDTINGIAAYGNGELITSLTDGLVSHHGLAFWTAGATLQVLPPNGLTLAANRAFLPLKGSNADLTADGLQVLANVLVELRKVQAVPAPLLTAPSGLVATAEENGTVTLAWTAGFGATTFSIKRSIELGGPYTTISAGVVNGVTYSDTSAVGGVPNYYVVSAVNASAESPNSNEATATPVAVANPLQTWRQSNFGSGENSGTGADDADPDGDGINNLIEYAIGTDPKSSNSAAAAALGRVGDALTLTFNRIADPSLVYTVRGSTTLGDWSETPIFSSTGSANTPGPVTVEDSPSMASQSKRFLRLEVSY
jgi:hypothetical protein